MSIKAKHQCAQDGYWDTVTVPSQSEKGKYYEVLIMDPTDLDEIICECLSYQYRGRCSHQIEAIDRLCLWSEDMGPEQQTEEESKNKICPRCGQSTERVLELE